MKSSRQMTIQTGMEHMALSDIQHTTNEILEIETADFFHYKTTPDRVLEFTWFKQLMVKAKYVPQMKKLGVRKLCFFFL